jgi:hypothetical protein
MALPFKTPTNQQSFSGLVDAAVMATGKPASLISITQYANNVVRECQALGLFAADLTEVQEIVPVGTDASGAPFTWNVSPLFRSLRTVQYIPGDCNNPAGLGGGTPGPVWPDLILPGKAQRHKLWYYYRSQGFFAFAGAGDNCTINMAQYSWQPQLGYYNQQGVNSASFPGGPYDTRLAYYDIYQSEWMYLQADGVTYENTTGDPTTDAEYQALSSNWLILNWYDLILSGTKSKMWTSAGDPRAGAEYSNYKQMQKLLQNTTQYESEGF